LKIEFYWQLRYYNFSFDINKLGIDLRNFLYAITLLLTLSLLSGCSKISDEELTIARQAAQNGAVIVDVRTPSEFKQKHIDGAINLPLQTLERGYLKIPQGKEVVIYCKSGSRSRVGANVLRAKGFRVYDVATQGEWEREIKK